MLSGVNFQGCQCVTVFDALNTVISCATICPLVHLSQGCCAGSIMWDHKQKKKQLPWSHSKFWSVRGTCICVRVKASQFAVWRLVLRRDVAGRSHCIIWPRCTPSGKLLVNSTASFSMMAFPVRRCCWLPRSRGASEYLSCPIVFPFSLRSNLFGFSSFSFLFFWLLLKRWCIGVVKQLSTGGAEKKRKAEQKSERWPEFKAVAQPSKNSWHSSYLLTLFVPHFRWFKAHVASFFATMWS